MRHSLLLSTNATSECLRDLELEDAALQVSVRGEAFQPMRWCRSLNGDEYGRVRGWSEHPACRVSVLGYAIHRGFGHIANQVYDVGRGRKHRSMQVCRVPPV